MSREYKVLAGVLMFLASLPPIILTTIFNTIRERITLVGTYWLFAAVTLSSNILYVFFSGGNKENVFVKIMPMLRFSRFFSGVLLEILKSFLSRINL